MRADGPEHGGLRSCLSPRSSGCVAAGAEEQGAEPLPTDHPPQFLDGKEREERHDHDEAVGEDFVAPFRGVPGKPGRQAAAVPEAHDHMLDDTEEAEHGGDDAILGGIGIEGGARSLDEVKR